MIKPDAKNKSTQASKNSECAYALVRKIHKDIMRIGSMNNPLLPVKKFKTRIVEQGIVKSTRYAHQMYPVVLDIQHDGAFSSATYPNRVPSDKLKDVALVLSYENFRARYGKFAIDFNSREVKFRVFRSAVDIDKATENSCQILRTLPVQMMDQISQTIDEIIAGSKAGKSVVEKIMCVEKGVVAANKNPRKALRVECVKKPS